MSETPVVCLALPLLFDKVVARFDLECTEAEQSFGWRTPTKLKTTRARIAWVPGSPSGQVGDIGAPKKTGDTTTYRSLATLGELFTVYIEVSDPKYPENEREQYTQTRLMFDAWLRAVYLAAYGTFEIQSLDWNTEKNERRNGAELICVCTVEAVIPDAPHELIPTDATADISTSLEDVTEQTVTPTP